MRLIVLSAVLVAAVVVNCRNTPGPDTPWPQKSIRSGQRHEETRFTSEEPLDLEISHLTREAEDGMYLVDDMILDEEQWTSLRMRKAFDDPKRRWPKGSDGNRKVPYQLMYPVDRSAVRAGMKHWEDHTCIRFEETTNTSQPHLKFRVKTDEDGNYLNDKCSSNVGMLYYTHGQFVNIGGRCYKLDTVVHEIGHAIGFHHEQARSNRDDYITIMWENMREDSYKNFKQFTDNNFSIPYDYSSIMHYKAYSSSKEKYNKLTIETKDPLALEILGIGTVLSHRDKLLANRMYNCTDKWLTACGNSSDPCKNDGYIGENCSCVCPPGTRGSLCETVFEDYYAHLRNPISEEIDTEKSIKVETPIEGYKFVKWITPPKCKKATLTFTNSNMDKNCKRQFLHVKTDPSDKTGRILCANDVKRGVTLMSETQLAITMFNKINEYGDEKVTLWEADVTFNDILGCKATTTTATKTTTTSPGGDHGVCIKMSRASCSNKYVAMICKLMCQGGPDWCSSIFEIEYEWPQTVSGWVEFTFPNTVSSWNLELTFNKDITDLIIWNMDRVMTSDKTVTLIPKHWNKHQMAGNILRVDFQIKFDGSDPSKLISTKLNGEELCK